MARRLEGLSLIKDCRKRLHIYCWMFYVLSIKEQCILQTTQKVNIKITIIDRFQSQVEGITVFFFVCSGQGLESGKWILLEQHRSNIMGNFTNQCDLKTRAV